MNKRVFAAACALTLFLSGCMTVSAPAETPAPESPYKTTTYYIRHTALDPQGRQLSVFIETPVFSEESEGYQKINAFFEDMEKDFFSSENTTLASLWELDSGYTQRVEHSAKVLLQTEKLVCVQISVYYATGRSFDWTDSYTFDAQTGERLMLSDLVEEPEDEALDILWTTLENSQWAEPLFWDNIEDRALDDFDFFLDNDKIYIAFDVDEAAMTSTGSWTLYVPLTLKPEWRVNQ